MHKTEIFQRRKTKKIKVGSLYIGGDAPISVQSMTNSDTRDIDATVKQIQRLTEAGCELVRVAVPDMKSAENLSEIKSQISIPLVADIHFDYKLALKAIEQGIDKLRLNPGNIRNKQELIAIITAAKDKKIPIRIGVNAGSIPQEIIAKYHGITPETMVESALWEIDLFEKHNFNNIIISLKTSDVPTTLNSYRLMAKKVEYPFHLGITEAGPAWCGTIKSAVGIGILLAEGIGDTIRVSLTADPVEEVKVGWEILKSLGLRLRGVNLISCPTCGRCEVDLLNIVKQLESKLDTIKMPITIAVMGCVVNGPGEAKIADIGIAAGKGSGVLFRHGKIVKKVPESEFISALLDELKEMQTKNF
ncbi:MAG: flavodoxin-dependent (E)-4-hydroxy-3-methylbut-2-enyl-diphosphate synthase [bacterium]|nr:flavodoxin-dependent (E)-4-hydroxy-3-methylbut-2-enyl-diphosphate synthase [bacterium]